MKDILELKVSLTLFGYTMNLLVVTRAVWNRRKVER